MTLNELMEKILVICPDAIVSEDMHGEVVIATGYKVSGEGLVEITPMDMGVLKGWLFESKAQEFRFLGYRRLRGYNFPMCM